MIRVSGLSLSLGNYSLKNFSMEVREGEYYILLGPSGAGKSVILETIAGFYPAAAGRIEIDGNDVTNLPPEARDLGYVPQDDLLMPHLNVRDNIYFSADIRKIPRRDMEAFFNYLIDVLGIGYILDETVATLSGGERQRTAIARAMLLKPRIMLLDEPMSSLDLPAKKKIINALGSIHRDTGVTFLHVTHNQEEAFVLGDVISLIFDGGIEQTGRKNRLYFFPKTLNVAQFTGMGNIFTGTVESVDSVNKIVSIKTGSYLFRITPPVYQSLPEEGKMVNFGIRAEEVMVLRPDEKIKPILRDNVINGTVSRITEKTYSHTVFFRDERGELELEIELANLVYRRLQIREGMELRVSLKSSSIWISLETVCNI